MPTQDPQRIFAGLPVNDSPRATRPLRICIASPEFTGAVRNGGIGTAYTALARALVARGHDVTCLYLEGNTVAGGSIAHWVEQFRREGIRLVPLPQIEAPVLDAPRHAVKSFETYQWLKQNDQFDVVHFPEWQGFGYYSLCAKHQGLAFGRTTFCVGIHSATSWLKAANRECLSELAELEMDFMERQSVALADVMISPSRYLLDWVRDHGWTLPARCHVQQNILPQSARPSKKTVPGRLQEITELVFFGRLETRKGIVLFCDALDRLPDEVRAQFKSVTFLGREATVEGVPARAYIEKRARRWPWKIQNITDYDQPHAVEYLRGTGRLAVIPSLLENSPYTVLESLGAGIAFLASRTGGIPELIDPEDHDRVCFDPNPPALTALLGKALAEGFQAARPAVNADVNEETWMAWHESLPVATDQPLAGADPAVWPKVSLCLTTFNRPGLLRQALDSLQALDYPDFEVVLVDDGSTQPEALAVLTELEPSFARRGWRIIRQKNLYLGAARNTAARQATGEYLLFMDDDNFAEPGEISALVKVALHTGADIVSCGMNYFSGQQAPNLKTPPKSRWLPLGGAAVVGAFRNCFGDANALVRRSCFERLGGFTEDYGVTHEDWEFHARAVLQGFSLEVIPEFPFWYRVNPDSMIRTLNRYHNHMRNIRPYRDAVPAALRDLVYFAQGQFLRSLQNPGQARETQFTVAWRSKLEAARIFVQQNQKETAVRLLLEAVKSVETARHPIVVFEALATVGQELRTLDIGRARQLLQLALQLAKAIEDRERQQAVLNLIDSISGKPESPTPSKNGAPGVPAISAAGPAPASPGTFAVSIIILAHNQLEHTRLCLDSIRAHTPLPHELILVDNASTDGTAEYFASIAAQQKNTVVITNRRNVGFAGGNNQGLAVARGDCVVLLNNDTVVTEGWLEEMLDVLQRHPDIGIVGPMSNYVAGPQLVPDAAYGGDLSKLPAFAAEWSRAHAGQTQDIGRVVGFCLLARRSVIERVGGLDEQFGSGNFEDDDFCLRAGFAGFRICIARDAFVHHTGSRTFIGAKIDYRESMLRNWKLFKAKWGIAQDAPVEGSYRVPVSLPPTAALKVPLPKSGSSQTPEASVSRAARDSKAATKPAPMVLPPCALVGRLSEARDFLRKKQLETAWNATLAALQSRPYHPEAFLLLAEIALAAGDSVSARQCAQHARNLAPEWKLARQFLNGNLRGNSKPAWLVLPAAISNPPKTPVRLSVCLIAKNEEKFLGQCLASVRELAGQIVVVDTGSTDRTIEIARQAGAEVYEFKWTDDFSAARNEALKFATGDWVLFLDADEELLPAHRETMLQEMQTAPVMAWRLPIIDKGREDQGCSYVPRLFRNAPGLFYVGRVHEQIFTSVEVRRKEWGLENRLGKSALLHHGYTNEMVVSRDKIARNLRLLERAIEELPNEPNLIMSLGLELVRSGRLNDGLERYQEAFELMSALPAAQVVPELRETLLSQYATHLMAAKRFPEIAQLWQTPLAKSAPMTASQHFLLGLADMELKEPAKAAEQMRQCLAKRSRPALSPVNPEILKAGPNHCLALSLAALKQNEEALAAFRAALSDDPRSRAARFDFARFQFERGEGLEALKLLHELVTEKPGDAPAWQFGGQIALSRPEFFQFARDWTGEAHQHFPQDSTITLQRAEALLLAQDADAALPLWTAAPSPKSARDLAALVICEAVTGSFERRFAAGDEAVVSRELAKWYKLLLAARANGLLTRLNQEMESLRAVTPSFVKLWQAAAAEARRVPVAA